MEFLAQKSIVQNFPKILMECVLISLKENETLLEFVCIIDNKEGDAVFYVSKSEQDQRPQHT